MNKILVVGANGFIGTRLSIELAKQGFCVIALVDYRFPYDALLSNKNIITKEFILEDLDLIRDDEVFNDIDTIYHLAWVGVNANLRNSVDTQLQNITFGLKIMEFATYHRIKRVIIPGSAAELGCGIGYITGYERPAPSDMYSAVKVATRYVCQTYAKQHNIGLIWLLVTSIYGPSRNDNNLLTYVIQSFMKGEKPSTTKLEQKWDYIYIDDLVRAFILVGESGKDGKIYPIGSGEVKMLREYVEIIRDLINPQLSIGLGDIEYKNPDKIDNQIFDLSELVKDTGFHAQYSFVDGIKEVLKHYNII